MSEEEIIFEGDISKTCLSERISEIFQKLSNGSGDGRRVCDAWRQSLGAVSDDDLYYALSIIRRMLCLLKTQVNSSVRIKEKNKPFNIRIIDDLIKVTSVDSLVNNVSSHAQAFSAERMHNIDSLSNLIDDEYPAPILPSEHLKAIVDAFLAIQKDVESSSDMPAVLKEFLLIHIRRLLWAIRVSSTVGIDIVIQSSAEFVGVFRNPPTVPPESEGKVSELMGCVKKPLGRLMELIDYATKSIGRAKTAAAIGGAISDHLISSAL